MPAPVANDASCSRTTSFLSIVASSRKSSDIASFCSATTAAGPVGRGAWMTTSPACTSWKSACVTSNSPCSHTRQISATERWPSTAENTASSSGSGGMRFATRAGTCSALGMRSRKYRVSSMRRTPSIKRPAIRN